MTSDEATTWMARGVAIATAVAAIELIVVWRAWSERGVFAWSVLRREFAAAPAPVRAVADVVFSTAGMWLLVGAQLAAAVAVGVVDHPAVPWVGFAATLAIAIRFRGSYNGGSDAMLLVVWLALALARTDPGGRGALGGLAYAAVQLVFSYFLAGVAKLRDPVWRRGGALPILVGIPRYGVPAPLATALSGTAARLASHAMLAFELGFPLALVDRRICIGLLAVAAAFHLVNAVVFGLNRFLWTWLAAFPALVFWVDRLRGL